MLIGNLKKEIEIEPDLGFPIVRGRQLKPFRSGVGRNTFKYKDYLFKVEFMPETYIYSQTKYELDIWRKISKADRNYFATILASGRSKDWIWIITEQLRFKKFNKRSMHEFNTAFTLVVEPLAEKYCFSDVDLAGVASHNWGITTDNKIKIFDWGTPVGV